MTASGALSRSPVTEVTRKPSAAAERRPASLAPVAGAGHPAARPGMLRPLRMAPQTESGLRTASTWSLSGRRPLRHHPRSGNRAIATLAREQGPGFGTTAGTGSGDAERRRSRPLAAKTAIEEARRVPPRKRAMTMVATLGRAPRRIRRSSPPGSEHSGGLRCRRMATTAEREAAARARDTAGARCREAARGRCGRGAGSPPAVLRPHSPAAARPDPPRSTGGGARPPTPGVSRLAVRRLPRWSGTPFPRPGGLGMSRRLKPQGAPASLNRWQSQTFLATPQRPASRTPRPTAKSPATPTMGCGR